jgi:hypothetical protein
MYPLLGKYGILIPEGSNHLSRMKNGKMENEMDEWRN